MSWRIGLFGGWCGASSSLSKARNSSKLSAIRCTFDSSGSPSFLVRGVQLVLVVPEIDRPAIRTRHGDADDIPARVRRNGHKAVRHPLLIHLVGDEVIREVRQLALIH